MKIIKPEGMRFIRASLKISGASIADKLHITRMTVYNIETGRNTDLSKTICISIILLNALEKADIPQDLKDLYIENFCEEIDL